MLILWNVQWVWRHSQKWMVMPSRGAVLPNSKQRYAEGRKYLPNLLYSTIIYIFTSSSSRFLFLPPPLSPPFNSAVVIRWVVWPSSLLFPDILTPRVNRSESPGSFTQVICFHTPFCLTNMLETNPQQVGPASLKHEAFRLTGRRPGGNLWCHCTANVLFNSVFSYWPAVSRKLQWLCMLINIPTELLRLHLSLITMCKYEDSPVIDVNHTANAGRERLAIK